LEETKPFTISKELVLKSFKLVKANAGAAGVDQQSLADFEVHLKDNLYKLWNRMSSGSYFPPPVIEFHQSKKRRIVLCLAHNIIQGKMCTLE
jgi:retron-type reverse transcriptase